MRRYINKNKFIVKKLDEVFKVYQLNNSTNKSKFVVVKSNYSECEEYVSNFWNGVIVRRDF